MLFLKRGLAPGTILSLLLFVILSSCNSYKKNDSHREISNASIRNGELLAATYCQSCHSLPDPSMLDTKTWENSILPAMGPRLGIFESDNKIYPSNQHDSNLSKGFYPSQPLVNNEEWRNIIDYYTAISPDSMLPQQRSCLLYTSDAA